MSKFPLFHKLIATSFGAGYSPVAPGTMGALVAVAVWYVLWLNYDYCTLQSILIALIVVFTILGTWSASVSEKFWGEDPKRVVMDETVGEWIALLAVPASGHWGYVLAAFVLFRFFDIVKPLGVRSMERFKGGFGIMADDLLSGVYAAIVMLIFNYFI
jgi:phosphatidylglycerophosphatase A